LPFRVDHLRHYAVTLLFTGLLHDDERSSARNRTANEQQMRSRVGPHDLKF